MSVYYVHYVLIIDVLIIVLTCLSYYFAHANFFDSNSEMLRSLRAKFD